MFLKAQLLILWMGALGLICVSKFWAAREGAIPLNVCNSIVGRSVMVWCLPEKGVLKINVDKSFVGKSGKGGISVIVRDDEGRVVDGFFGSCCVSSGFMAKASALRMVVDLAGGLLIQGLFLNLIAASWSWQ